MLRRTFIRRALALLAAPAGLAAVGCGPNNGVEQPSAYSVQPTNLSIAGPGGGKQKGQAKAGGKPNDAQ
jgi:hypothetical protein